MAGRQNIQTRRPGFQGSETSGAEATIYSQGGDPIVLVPGNSTLSFERYRTDPRSNPGTLSPTLLAATTTKSLGSPSGTFSLTAKARKPNADFIDLFDGLVDDDWVDVTFTRHGRRYHTMRGLIDDVRREEGVSGGGATTTTFSISGRDFGKIWELTPVWFSPQALENVHGHVAAKVFTAARADEVSSDVAQDTLILSSPSSAVRGYLFGFLEELEGVGRANWDPPPKLPGITDGKFIKSLYYNNHGFANLPPRRAIDPSFITAGGTLWDLAKQWSDPLFTELWVDLLPGGDVNLTGREQGEEILVTDSKMTVVFRDKPFPVVAEEWDGPKGGSSPWFGLPIYTIPREAIVSLNVGRTGLERFNAYFVTSPLYQETLGGAAIDVVAPLWDKQDILLHGLRRFDVQSSYGVPEIAADPKLKDRLLNLLAEQRALIRDWYSLNPYYFNGTLDLGVGVPDIRVGSRVRIPHPSDPQRDEWYYVESVTQSWTFGVGLRTSLGVTRGWRGTEDSLLDALQKMAARYEIEPLASPEQA